jgi:hypothetical protein
MRAPLVIDLSSGRAIKEKELAYIYSQPVDDSCEFVESDFGVTIEAILGRFVIGFQDFGKFVCASLLTVYFRLYLCCYLASECFPCFHNKYSSPITV